MLRIAAEERRTVAEERRIVDHTEMVHRIVGLVEVLHIAVYCNFAVEVACSLDHSDIGCTFCQDSYRRAQGDCAREFRWQKGMRSYSAARSGAATCCHVLATCFVRNCFAQTVLLLRQTDKLNIFPSLLAELIQHMSASVDPEIRGVVSEAHYRDSYTYSNI